MKVWNGYGSEHSMNLMMIGSFKTAESAAEAKKLIDLLSNKLPQLIDIENSSPRYTDEVHKLLWDAKCHLLSPSELEQFLYDVNCDLDGSQISIHTDESDVSGFMKLMIEKGAKIEVYSAHDYPTDGDN